MILTLLTLQRQPSYKETTFGSLDIDGDWFCHTLEDMIREIPGVPVAQWKVKKKTAIPAGRYRITLEDSPRFGPDTITLHDVDGFDYIRMHGGNDIDDTEGCPVVGSMIDREACRIAGAQTAGVLRDLKARIRAGLGRGEVWIEVKNP